MKSTNGSKQWLLWANTLLTAGAAFIGTRLWDKIDRVHDRQIAMDKDLTSVVERQTEFGKEQRAILQHLSKLDKSVKP